MSPDDDHMDDVRAAELERTTRIRGFRFGLHDFYAQLDLDLLRKSNDLAETSYVNDGLLDRKTKELLIFVGCMASGDTVPHLQIHMHAAHRAGATPEELLEMIALVQMWIGVPRAKDGLEAWRATFRPDIETIDRVVELR